MKSKTLKYIFSVVFVFITVIAMFTMTTLKVNAEENEYVSPTETEAKIYGASVNLGGDISMKYYVEIGSDIDINNLVLETFFLGKVENLTAEEQTVIIDGHTLYVYTLSSINPQCMGDPIDAKLVYNGSEMEGDRVSKNGYSVKTNLENTYKNTSDENLKNLIIDTLKYGAAAQEFKDYKTDALVTNGELADVIASDTDNTGFYNQGYEYTGATDEIYLAKEGAVTINFSNVNTIKFKYAAPEGSKVTINGEEVTPTKDGDYWVVETKAIAATDFYDLYTVVIADTVTVKYSVNTYSYNVFSFDNASEEMKSLAIALYNYGLSAHIVEGKHKGGNATCAEQAICTICGNGYGNLLDHNYTYTVNEESNTITESCDQGCGHNKTITLKAPENLVYDGNEKAATVDGELNTTCEITYNADPINVGTYTATLNAGGESVSLDFAITKANATVKEAPNANTLTYTGDEQELISAGSSDFGTMVYSLSEDGEYTENIPTAINAGKYVVYYYVKGNENVNDSEISSIEVEIAKAESTIKTDPEANDLTYAGINQLLVTEGISDDGTLVYSLEENGEYTTAIPYGTNAGEYKVCYYVQGDLNHNDSEKYSIDVTIKKAPLTITANEHTITYGDDCANSGVSYTGFVNGETVDNLLGTLSYSYNYEKLGDVGEYKITLSGLTSDNYEITFVDGVLTVEQKQINIEELVVTLDQESLVYDSTEKKPNVTSITLNGQLIETKYYDIAYEDNVYVGEAKVIITFKGNYAGTATKTFEITQDPKTTEFEGEWVTIPKN